LVFTLVAAHLCTKKKQKREIRGQRKTFGITAFGLSGISLRDIALRIQSNITLSVNEIVLYLQLNIMLPPPVPGKRAIPDIVEKKLRHTFSSSQVTHIVLC
jgi:hypothetical protein